MKARMACLAAVVAVFVSVCGCGNRESSGTQMSKLVRSYLAATDEKAKVEILDRMLTGSDADSHAAFYEALRRSDVADAELFKDAFVKHGTPELLLNLSHYIRVMRSSIASSGAGDDNSERLDKMLGSLSESMEAMVSEIGLIARKNPQLLEHTFYRAVRTGEKIDVVGPLLGLTAMGEEGAATLLAAAEDAGKPDSDDAIACARLIAGTFGPNTVVPALKQYENPSSTKEQRDIASSVICFLPDTERVYDKVVEAYRHGRYFKIPGLTEGKDGKPTITTEALIAAMMTWWGNDIKAKYGDNKTFIDYVGGSCLDADEPGQDNLIELLGDLDFSEAALYFAALDVNALPDKSLDALVLTTFVPTEMTGRISRTEKKPKYEVEKFALLCHIFKELRPSKRAEKKLIFTVLNASPDYLGMFVDECAPLMTDEEKTTVAYHCAQSHEGHESISQLTKVRVLSRLSVGASQAVRDAIAYAGKKTEM